MRSKFRKRCLLLILLVIGIHLGAGFVFAQADEYTLQKAKEYFSAGREFIRQGNFTAADNEFRKAQQLLGATLPVAGVKLKPAPVSVQKPEEKIKETKAAASVKDRVSYYLKEIKLKPKNADLHYNLALEYINNKEFRLAEEELKRALQLNRRDKNSCYNLGVLYEIYLGNRAQAIYYYSRYIRLAPRAEDVWRVKVWIKDIKKQIANEK